MVLAECPGDVGVRFHEKFARLIKSSLLPKNLRQRHFENQRGGFAVAVFVVNERTHATSHDGLGLVEPVEAREDVRVLRENGMVLVPVVARERFFDVRKEQGFRLGQITSILQEVGEYVDDVASLGAVDAVDLYLRLEIPTQQLVPHALSVVAGLLQGGTQIAFREHAESTRVCLDAMPAPELHCDAQQHRSREREFAGVANEI
mmetsp:Transcript_14717/g.44585  ORF Transcript_14717/g.44585 Transcript_14717/m.44585 type:complete len:204 (+) Transcript_14717:1150-1761(+)